MKRRIKIKPNQNVLFFFKFCKTQQAQSSIGWNKDHFTLTLQLCWSWASFLKMRVKKSSHTIAESWKDETTRTM
jgi:hypothetical protein